MTHFYPYPPYHPPAYPTMYSHPAPGQYPRYSLPPPIPSAHPAPSVAAQPALSPHIDPTTPSGMFDNDRISINLSVTGKSIFEDDGEDSSRLVGGNLDINFGMTPGQMSIQGMSPPMSNLRDTFASPALAGNLPNLSPEDAAALNKTLFSADTALSPFPKTPRTEVMSPVRSRVIKISIGSDETIGHGIDKMTVGNRVSISPIHKDAGCAKFFQDDDDFAKTLDDMLDSEASEPDDDDREKMPPPSVPRSSMLLSRNRFNSTIGSPRHITQETPAAKGAPTPFDSSSMIKHLTQTPSTAATVEQSFWSDQLEMSPSVTLSPFSSPKQSCSSSIMRGALSLGTTAKARVNHGEEDESNEKRSQSGKTGCSPLAKKRREDGNIAI